MTGPLSGMFSPLMTWNLVKKAHTPQWANLRMILWAT